MGHRQMLVLAMLVCCTAVAPAHAQRYGLEVSDDGLETVSVDLNASPGQTTLMLVGVPYGAAPDWSNALRRQVGGLQAQDMNGDGWVDIVVGCYISDSFPPYTDWENLIYYNIGGEPEANPSWVSTDEVSTGDIQVGDINGDTFPDVFAANGGFAMSPSVIYWGSASGPSTSPGWTSAEPNLAWNNYALLADLDADSDLDVVTANQGNSPTDPYRPMFMFRNNAGVLETAPSWQSAETSIQNFLALANYDGDRYPDVAVSKWSNFETGIYRTVGGNLQTTPSWTTGSTSSDKGVAWADVDGNGWPDLALGRNPTTLFSNTSGTLSATWTSTATFFGHSELRFCDVDKDGDDDLAETHFSDGKVHVYLNNSGVLSSAPSWTYDSPTTGTAIAFGDVNGDTWPDLIVGNSGDPCVKVFYSAGPDVQGDFDNNGHVQLDDYQQFNACLTWPGEHYGPDCGLADLTGDGDADLEDYSQFANAFTGAP